MIRTIEVRLSIPDNEARTALTTLQRLGVEVDALERAHVYRCDVDAAYAASAIEELRHCESVFNPNKHVMLEAAGDAPRTGEVWVHESGRPPATGAVVIAGRTLVGFRSIERYTAWRVIVAAGPAAPELVARATHALLCNSAFQEARFEDIAR